MVSSQLTRTPGDRAPGGTTWDPEVQRGLCFLGSVRSCSVLLLPKSQTTSSWFQENPSSHWHI